jgi:hypothetical protein
MTHDILLLIVAFGIIALCAWFLSLAITPNKDAGNFPGYLPTDEDDEQC